jgi:hypothetical protein
MFTVQAPLVVSPTGLTHHCPLEGNSTLVLVGLRELVSW